MKLCTTLFTITLKKTNIIWLFQNYFFIGEFYHVCEVHVVKDARSSLYY